MALDIFRYGEAAKDVNERDYQFLASFADAAREDKEAMLRYFISHKPASWFDKLSEIERQAIAALMDENYMNGEGVSQNEKEAFDFVGDVTVHVAGIDYGSRM